jgi:hypothetical protein
MYRMVNSTLWRQPWFMNLGPEARLIYLYLLTGAELHPNGIGFIDAKRIAFDLSLFPTAVEYLLTEDLKDRVLIFREHGLLWLRGFSEAQGSGPKWKAAVEKANAEIPPSVLEAIRDTPAIEYAYPIGILSMGHPPGTGTGEGTPSGSGSEQGRGTAQQASPTPAPAKKLRAFSHPEWFDPLKALEGYKDGGHEKAIETIRQISEYRGVEPSEVVRAFCIYWPIGKIKHSKWHTPVASLANTIEVQIDKVLAQRNGSGPNQGRGRRAEAHTDGADFKSWTE